jgi:hypothetical protein
MWPLNVVRDDAGVALRLLAVWSGCEPGELRLAFRIDGLAVLY